MRATQLLGCQVYDADGDLLGHVHDLRFEASSPSAGHKTGWNCRLTGLACGRRSPVGALAAERHLPAPTAAVAGDQLVRRRQSRPSAHRAEATETRLRAGERPMTETGGLALLFAWLIFAALLAVLAFFVLRPASNPDDEAERQPEEPASVP
jgi:hypothetical protein